MSMRLTDLRLLAAALDVLEARGCQNDFCPGPARRTVSYGSVGFNEVLATCYVCREVWPGRRLGLPPADWHPGPALVPRRVRVVA
jgi:hypothetical protein